MDIAMDTAWLRLPTPNLATITATASRESPELPPAARFSATCYGLPLVITPVGTAYTT